MNIESKAAASNALGAKTARPCDSCLIKRARWFCAADDAFLCHSCDAAVHSANQLATRHQRLRLETSSCKPSAAEASPPPAWHHGFTKKARTPRQPKAPPRHHLPLVPELGADDPFPEENEEQLFCRVPVFDASFADDEFGAGNMVFDYDDHEACRELNLEELLGGCEAADVESLLGSDSATGVLVDDGIILMDGKRVKSEDDEDGVMARHLDMEMNWDWRRTKKEDIVVVKKGETLNERKRMLLRLNYGAVIAAWASQGCPWTDGIRPQFHDLDWLGGSVVVGAGREARVWRYREKRRRRLFCKKIRYQVRKLNAEKRPRMKGRFVKKTPPYFDSTSSSLPNYHFIVNNKSSII